MKVIQNVQSKSFPISAEVLKGQFYLFINVFSLLMHFWYMHSVTV